MYLKKNVVYDSSRTRVKRAHGLIRCFQIVAPDVGQTKIFLVGNSLLITIL